VQALERLDFQTPGATEELAQSLRSASLLAASELDGQTEAQDLFAAARAEYGRLLGALYAGGHYSGVITIRVDGREAASIAPLDAPNRIDVIEVVVQPGPAFRLSAATVTPLAPGTDLPTGFVVGAPAGAGVIRDAAAAGVGGWRNIGHAKAEVAGQDIVADHRARALSAAITLNPGPKLRFGPMTVIGAERMRERRIIKIAGLPEGEVYSPDDLNRAAERLRRTGVFRSVTLTESEMVLAPDLLPITATVIEEKPRRYSFGAEIASFEGVSLTGYWLHRNLLGGAERLRVDGEVGNIGAQDSGIDYSLGLSIDRPATLTPDTTLGFATEVGHIDDVDYSADLVTLAAGRGRRGGLGTGRGRSHRPLQVRLATAAPPCIGRTRAGGRRERRAGA
jgi:translocation and assembly module TamA